MTAAPEVFQVHQIVDVPCQLVPPHLRTASDYVTCRIVKIIGPYALLSLGVQVRLSECKKAVVGLQHGKE